LLHDAFAQVAALLTPHPNASQSLLPELLQLLPMVGKVTAEANRTHRLDRSVTESSAVKLFRYVQSDELRDSVVTALLSNPVGADEHAVEAYVCILLQMATVDAAARELLASWIHTPPAWMPKALREELPRSLQNGGWRVDDSGALHCRALPINIPLTIAGKAHAISGSSSDDAMKVHAAPSPDRTVLLSGHYMDDVSCACGRRVQTLLEVDLTNALMRPIFDMLGGLTLLRVPNFCVCMFGGDSYSSFLRFDLNTCIVTPDPESTLLPDTMKFELPMGYVTLGADEWSIGESPPSHLGGLPHWYHADDFPACTSPGCDGGEMLFLACVEVLNVLLPGDPEEEGSAILVFVCTHCCRQGAVALRYPP
jgi:hypothetical protein